MKIHQVHNRAAVQLISWLLTLYALLPPAAVLASLRPVSDCWAENIRAELQFLYDASQPRRIRTMLEFAEQDFVIPKGDFKGRRFREYRAPWAGALIREFDTQRWKKHITTGCVQSGKTLISVVLPALYYLLESGEDVICGIPSIKMAGDKWRKEFLPALMASKKFRDMLPTEGRGSRSRNLDSEASFTFSNGATLKFMSGVGGDEQRSAYTARILVVTEADRMDTSKESSRESDPIEQLIARTLSYGDRARIFLECTVTIPKGKIWTEYNDGSRGRLFVECCHCKEWVSPERESLVGYDDPLIETKIAAKKATFFMCPACSGEWTPAQRKEICRKSTLLVHRGQHAVMGTDGGSALGDLPETDTCGFRWNAFHNLFWEPGEIGAEEWDAIRKANRNNSEKKMRQWFWALPAVPLEEDLVPLSLEDILERKGEYESGDELLQPTQNVVPPDTIFLSAAIDCRASQIHYIVIAWRLLEGEALMWPLSSQVIDYGIVKTDIDLMTVQMAVEQALNDLADNRLDRPYYDQRGKGYNVWWCPVDAGWKAPVVRKFCRNRDATIGNRYIPSFGRGQSTPRGKGSYAHPDPTAESEKIPRIGEEYHIRYHEVHELYAVFANSDEWKTYVKEAMAAPMGTVGAMVLYNAIGRGHEELCRHLVAETQVEKVVPGRGSVLVWENETGRVNHYLDVAYMASVAGHLSMLGELERQAAAEEAAAEAAEEVS